MKKLNVIMASMAVAILASCGGNGSSKVTMNDVKDTISYSIGMGRAVRVYKEQLPYDIIDASTMKEFVRGFMEAASDPEDKDKLAYALGYEIGCQEMTQAYVGLSESLFGAEGGTFNKSNYVKGFRDGMLDNWDIMTFEEADETSNRLYTELTTHQYDKIKADNKAYLEEKAKDKNVVKTASGLLYEVVKLGNGGPKPTAESTVEVRYCGKLIDGTVFDETEDESVSFPLNGVIKGWTEGLQLMSVGDKYTFYLPYDLAYGEQGTNGIKPYSTLIFDVELVSIK